MFDANVKNQPTAERRRDACRAWIMGELGTGSFYLTNVLMEDEPYRTLGLECLDGIVVDSGKPVIAEEVLRERCPAIRLIAISNDGTTVAYDGKGQIKVRRTRTEVIPGTSHTRKISKDEPIGKDVTLSHSEARRVLVSSGWPMRDHRSKGNHRGTVVEWEWLKVEAQKSTATKEVTDLHASIRDAIEPAAPAAHAASASKTRGAESRA